jgi:hypothetical protein
MARWNHKISLQSGTKLPQTPRFNLLWKRYKPVALIALRRLVDKHRVSRQDQERLFWLVESVWQAIKRGDDPRVAYDAAAGAGTYCLAFEHPRGCLPINRFRDVRRRPPKR